MLKCIARRGDMPSASLKNAKIVPTVGIVFEKLQRGTLLVDGLLQAAGCSQHLGQTGMDRGIIRLELGSLF